MFIGVECCQRRPMDGTRHTAALTKNAIVNLN